MSTNHHEVYPTLTDRERKLLYNKIQYRHKLSCMLRRFLHKETRSHGKRMVAKRVRALLYKRSLDPRGEPMCKRPAPWRCVIKVNDIAYLMRICERYAQEKLKDLKRKLGKRYVTVKEFCDAYMFDEEYVQRLLNDGDAREMNDPKWQKKIDAINRYWEEEMRKVKEAMKKEQEEEAQKKNGADEKKEAPQKKDDKKKKSIKPNKRKSFDGLDEDE
ncbi:hypothetical protein FAM09_10895 [Niastella caeni]|uniref:Uncharacterized protein n=1 Tax=Niastella caeni TaxID=2569763 RepID=A0A4V4H1F9_9BACT|nr:hypothetical protein [Niastella caeni]THU40366.1 hypothetical protein FAM09_10895 [Niastella caeni]